MTTTVHDSVRFTPQQVREVLSRHILVDGYHMVQDIEKSHGVFLARRRPRTRRPRLLRPFFHFAAGLQSSQAHHARVRPADPAGSAQQAGELRHLHHVHGRVRRDLRAYGARGLPQAPLLHRRRRARRSRTRSRSRSTGRCTRTSPPARGEKGSQILHFRQAFHGRTGYTMSLTNTRPAGRPCTSRSSTGRGS